MGERYPQHIHRNGAPHMKRAHKSTQKDTRSHDMHAKHKNHKNGVIATSVTQTNLKRRNGNETRRFEKDTSPHRGKQPRRHT